MVFKQKGKVVDFQSLEIPVILRGMLAVFKTCDVHFVFHGCYTLRLNSPLHCRCHMISSGDTDNLQCVICGTITN